MDDNTEEYCICRSTDISRFMIGCDNCNEWYHGDCIGMTVEQSNFIKIFFCDICRRSDPSLKIKYHKEKLREHYSSSRKHEKHRHSKKHSHGHREREREREKRKKRKEKHRDRDKRSKHHKRDKHKDKHRHKDKTPEIKVEDSSPEGTPCVTPVPGSPTNTTAAACKSESAASARGAWCPEPSPTSVSAPRQLEGRKSDHEQPSPLQRDARRELDGSEMRDVIKTEKSEIKPVKKELHHTEPVVEAEKPVPAAASRDCEKCIACLRKDDCGFCDNCREAKKPSATVRRKCRLRQCMNQNLAQTSEWDDLPTDDVDIPLPPSALANQFVKAKTTPNKQRGRPRKDAMMETPTKRKYKRRKPETLPTPSKRKYRKRRQESSDESENGLEDEVTQCFGPGCVEAARPGSKYCSDTCGMRLAKDRIVEILPTRVDQWQRKPCIAEIKNKEQLVKIRKQQDELSKQLFELDKKHREIDALVEKARQATVATEEEETEDEDPEMTIFCVTCGHQFSQKAAVRHMEKCYVKIEGRSSYASMFRARMEFTSLVCDHYSPQQGTFCKRLKVLCPEHTREPKVSPDEVCGCPLVEDLFTMTGDFCRLPKRKCNKHFKWERLRRAAIDQERLSQLGKLEELLEQERNIRSCMAERAGLLGLVLHQTIDHDPNSDLLVPPTREVGDIMKETSM